MVAEYNDQRLIEELKGRNFDFYILNKVNYEVWKAGGTPEAYLKATNVSLYEFSLHIRREDVTDLRLVVSNVYARELETEVLLDEVIKVPSWMGYYLYFTPPLSLKLPILRRPMEVKIEGTAVGNRAFNLIILDGENYDRWREGLSYNAFYEMRNMSTCSFTFKLTPEQHGESLYLVAQRTEPTDLSVWISANMSYMKPVDISVRYNADISWEERSYAPVLGGAILGGLLLFLGLVLMIAAAVVRYVFRTPARRSLRNYVRWIPLGLTHIYRITT
ncbi:MAG: hypothetical protein QXK42_01555 [Candidatus Korarchaeum sp.]